MMGLVSHIALVSDIGEIDASELTRVSAALSRQVLTDFGPIWNVQATVDPFVNHEDVPVDYWRITIKKEIGFEAAGIHLDQDGQPFSLVNYENQWSLAASHELLEMLADPFGKRLVTGPVPEMAVGLTPIGGDQPITADARVEFLVEVSDPSEGAEFGYMINGVLVSDFYTPNFFDTIKGAGVRYSFTGKILEPRQVLQGGYLSWHDLISDHWLQLRYFSDDQYAGPGLHILDLSASTTLNQSLLTKSIRSAIDKVTKPDRAHTSLQGDLLAEANKSSDLRAVVRKIKANRIRARIEEILKAAPEPTPAPPKPTPKKKGRRG